jgi:predicted nucleic acid-binding protein
VTVAEIAYAAARNGEPETISRLRDIVAAASIVLPFDADAAEVYGPLRAHLEGIGVRLDEPSLRIGLEPTHHRGNACLDRRYRPVGLRIENWLEPDDAELAEADADASVAEEIAVVRRGTARSGTPPRPEPRGTRAAATDAIRGPGAGTVGPEGRSPRRRS